MATFALQENVHVCEIPWGQWSVVYSLRNTAWILSVLCVHECFEIVFMGCRDFFWLHWKELVLKKMQHHVLLLFLKKISPGRYN